MHQSAKWLQTVIIHCLTGIDGVTYDIARICLALGINAFLGLEIYNTTILHVPFDAQSFGIGFGAILAAGGAAIGMKKETEPK